MPVEKVMRLHHWILIVRLAAEHLRNKYIFYLKKKMLYTYAYTYPQAVRHYEWILVGRLAGESESTCMHEAFSYLCVCA